VTRVLEARFHPQDGAPERFVVVAHVVCGDGARAAPPAVRPSASLADAGAPDTILAKLRYLVAAAMPEPLSRLPRLRSRFWSFVEVEPPSSTK
jgi:hypothetical protein